MARSRHFSFEAAKADLIDSVYAAATDGERWQDFNTRVSHWLGGGAALVCKPRDPTASAQILSGNIDPARMYQHDAYYHALSPWLGRIGKTHAVLDVVEAMMPLSELERSEYYNDWLKPQDYHHCVLIRPVLGNGDVIGLAMGRSRRTDAYDEAERQLMIDLSPHLGRAAEIARRFDLLAQEKRAVAQVLDGLSAATFVVDRNLRIVFANATAERLAATGEGLSARRGHLAGQTSRDDSQLRRAVTEATAVIGGKRGPGATFSVSRGYHAPLSLTVTPLDQRDHAGLGLGPFACVVASAPEQEARIDAERLRAAFDLTPAEARLAIALAAGQSLAEYGASHGVSVNTAKYHLKALFEKTGETRQTDLVRRLLGNAAVRAAPV